jgi:hypothetical protein
MKVKVITTRGLRHGGTTHPEGAELELTGPHLDAALHFKQVEPAQDAPPKEKRGAASPGKPSGKPLTNAP